MTTASATIKQQEPNVSAEKSDKAFLEWIYDRLRYVHGESPRVDYMQRLQQVIGDMSK